MFVRRVFGRALLAAAKSEPSAAGAATARAGYNPLEEFFEADRSPDEDKPVVYGTSLFLFNDFGFSQFCLNLVRLLLLLILFVITDNQQ